MKIFKSIPKRSVVLIGAACLFTAMLSSCLKDNSIGTPIIVTPSALLTVIQASPDQPVLDFYLDQNKVNSQGISYGDDLDYFRAFVGKRAASFSNSSTGTKIVTDSVNLVADVPYSLFLVNKAATPQVLLLTDSLTKPAVGNASVRFVNVSPDAPAVDLAISSGSVFIANKAFKGFSSFKPIPGKTYSFSILKAGTSTVLATLNNVSIQSGYLYTIWLRGLVTPTGTTDKLTAGIITNAYYY